MENEDVSIQIMCVCVCEELFRKGKRSKSNEEQFVLNIRRLEKKSQGFS